MERFFPILQACRILSLLADERRLYTRAATTNNSKQGRKANSRTTTQSRPTPPIPSPAAHRHGGARHVRVLREVQIVQQSGQAEEDEPKVLLLFQPVQHQVAEYIVALLAWAGRVLSYRPMAMLHTHCR